MRRVTCDDETLSITKKHDRVNLGKRFLEHAPRTTGKPASGLLGWHCTDTFVCVECTGRIMARGCDLDAVVPNANAAWDELPKWVKGCDLCGRMYDNTRGRDQQGIRRPRFERSAKR